MKMSILLDKLRMEKKEFVTADEFKELCKLTKMNYDTVIRYFIWRKYFVRIFREVFYVRSLEEFKLGKSNYNHLELVSKGLELKGVKRWYFGLHTALKLNNMTHEHFTTEEVISDSFFRPKPVNIAGYKFRFVKISSVLLDFGIKTDNNMMMRYSDPEKTILDFIYLSKHKGLPDERIIMDVHDWSRNISAGRLKKYSKKYPKSITEIVDRVSK